MKLKKMSFLWVRNFPIFALFSIAFSQAFAQCPAPATPTLTKISPNQIDVAWSVDPDPSRPSASKFLIYIYEDGVDTTMKYIGTVAGSAPFVYHAKSLNGESLHGNTPYWFMVVSVGPTGCKTNGKKKLINTDVDTSVEPPAPPCQPEIGLNKDASEKAHISLRWPASCLAGRPGSGLRYSVYHKGVFVGYVYSDNPVLHYKTADSSKSLVQNEAADASYDFIIKAHNYRGDNVISTTGRAKK